MKIGRPFLRAAWTQNADPWKKAPGLRVSFLRKRVAENFFSRLILLFSPADVPAGNFSQLLQLTILACPSQALWPRVPVLPLASFPVLTRPSQLFWSRVPVLPLVSFSIPLFWPIPGLLFWASRSSPPPWSVSLFPSPCPP